MPDFQDHSVLLHLLHLMADTVKGATFKCNKIQTLRGKRQNKKGIGLGPHPKVTPACPEEGSVEEPKKSKATSGTEKGL